MPALIEGRLAHSSPFVSSSLCYIDVTPADQPQNESERGSWQFQRFNGDRPGQASAGVIILEKFSPIYSGPEPDTFR
jgi:hypothetical protein